MIVTPEIAKLIQKNGINKNTFYKRLSRGYTPMKAATMPLVKPNQKGKQYEVFASCAGTGVSQVFTGTTEVARYLTKKTHTNVTKNTLVGQIYRKGFAIVGKFYVRPL